VRGCWFHYGQAIIKQAAELGLNRGYRESGLVALIIQEMIGVALLPEDRIYAGFAVSKLFKLKISKGKLNNLPLLRYPVMPYKASGKNNKGHRNSKSRGAAIRLLIRILAR
jgi:hypothetical protein